MFFPLFYLFAVQRHNLALIQNTYFLRNTLLVKYLGQNYLQKS